MLNLDLDPRWANPIIERIRQKNQERAVNEVVNALKPSQTSVMEGAFAPLRVVNGISATTGTSSALTTAAQENFAGSPVDGLPGRRNSTIKWAGGLKAHPEVHEHEDGSVSDTRDFQPPPSPRKPINPSLSTLEKAVSARIYFENLYFPLFRHSPSREQRRVAMEKDMMSMQLSEAQKDNLRARWRQNETDYLRDQRRKVDASAFVKLKTIGHGLPIYPIWLHLNKINVPWLLLFASYRRVWGCVLGERAALGSTVCHETGIQQMHIPFTSHWTYFFLAEEDGHVKKGPRRTRSCRTGYIEIGFPC